MNTIFNLDLNEFNALCNTLSKYQALAQLIEQAINSQNLVFEQRLPAQRILADQLNITHGTVTRAYALLGARGLVTTKLGAGTYVSKKVNLIEHTKDTDFASSMQPMMGQEHIIAQAMQSLHTDLTALKEVMIYKLNGLESHQQFFKNWLIKKGITCSKHSLVFTQGAQQGIYTVLATICSSSEKVIAEQLCYPGFYRACEALNITLEQAPLTHEGIDVEHVEALCQSNDIKAVYITPNCQNPTNIRYSEQTLQKLLALSRRYNFYIIEDDVNYCLPEHWRPPLWQHAPDRVFYLSSFSKYFAGGLRTGYLLAPLLWQQSLLKQLHSECWSVSTMNFELLLRAMQNNEFDYIQAKLADEIRYRITALKQVFTECDVPAIFKGLNVYVPLPEHINMFALAATLKNHKVIVRTLDAFAHTLNEPINGIRLTLGGPNSKAEFNLGLERVREALRQFHHNFDVVV